MTWLDALKVGVAQCFALIPGTSRSGATIIGGMLFGLSRPRRPSFRSSSRCRRCAPRAPTICGRTARCSRRTTSACSPSASTVSFVSAFVVIRWLIRYVATHDFRPFAWYRIAFGAVVLLTAHYGWVDWKV